MKGAIENQSTISVSKNGWSSLGKLEIYINLPQSKSFLPFGLTYFLFLFSFLKTFAIPALTFGWNNQFITTQDKIYYYLIHFQPQLYLCFERHPQYFKPLRAQTSKAIFPSDPLQTLLDKK